MPLIRKDADAPKAPDRSVDLLEGLKSASSDTRWSSARQLGNDPTSVPALEHALATESDPRVREAMFTGLSRIQTPAAVAAILPHLRSQDAAVRAAALDALNAIPGTVETHLPGLLADPDPDVRLLVCDIVRRLPSEAATRYLCEVLDRETLPNVCGAMVEALSEVGDETALPVLARCAKRFADEAFLLFSITAASNRISGGERGHDSQRL